jgi:hypothetical protein
LKRVDEESKEFALRVGVGCGCVMEEDVDALGRNKEG